MKRPPPSGSAATAAQPRLVEGVAAQRESVVQACLAHPLWRRGALRPGGGGPLLMPLVGGEYRGRPRETERLASLFTRVTDGRGRDYDIPVVIGALAANRDIYCIGMGVSVEEIPAKGDHALANPIPPRLVVEAPCQEVVIEGEALVKAPSRDEPA